jgi:hypothetical protein
VKLIKNRTLNQERKNDTRRKILAGAYILHKCERENTLASFIAELNSFLSKDSDKALFKQPFKSIASASSLGPQLRGETPSCN